MTLKAVNISASYENYIKRGNITQLLSQFVSSDTFYNMIFEISAWYGNYI